METQDPEVSFKDLGLHMVHLTGGGWRNITYPSGVSLVFVNGEDSSWSNKNMQMVCHEFL